MEQIEMAVEDNDDQVTPVDSNNMEQTKMAVEDNDDQVTPVDSNNMEQTEMAVEDNDDQVTPADSINMEQTEMAVEDNDDQVTPADSINMEQTELTVDDENGMLVPLIDMLTDREKSGLPIDEFYFLDQFPATNVILPVVNCSPRQVIEFLINARRKPCDFNLRKLHYNYKINSINYTKTDVYTFTDAMTIEDDVIVICYLTCLEQQYLPMPGINELLAMMEIKYDIVLDNAKHKGKHFTITWTQILHSFPSIALACTYTPTKIPYSSDLCIYMDQLISSIKKRLSWIYLVASILPKLKSQSFPITCLVAMKIELIQLFNKIDASFRIETGLPHICRNITLLCLSEAFPEALKLKLCEKWNIIQKVKEQHNQYKFVHYFEELNTRALEIIQDLDAQEKVSCNPLPSNSTSFFFNLS